MSSVSRILILLIALVARSDALSCIQCMSTNSSCSGHSVTCPSGYVCGSSYTKTLIGGTKTAFIRACMPQTDCNIKGSMGMKQGHVWMVTSCCGTDNCTPGIPELPTKKSDRNKEICPSCVSGNSTWCSAFQLVQCRGDETICLMHSTKITGSISSSTAIKGCGTKSLCDLGSQFYSVEGSSIEVDFLCDSGAVRVHEVILTPAIACLLLLTFFF
ncbi:phospholipase A2 inhibitor and Ly6/PLAUR domain-containing protein-like [Leptodactylus fuscus]|uniref:phospholipase A2 inhibitor and Ly6/PLAUR domain-containing protein-like n=1 Tax=Leptodactylus fuscus TaxID=238119 RepID=UPI003F4F2DB6